jgi:hypothetical protein
MGGDISLSVSMVSNASACEEWDLSLPQNVPERLTCEERK